VNRISIQSRNFISRYTINFSDNLCNVDDDRNAWHS